MGAPAVTPFLVEWSHGIKAALDQFFPVILDELRRLARSDLRREASSAPVCWVRAVMSHCRPISCVSP